jgi:uncharacterized protein with HEPN domain
MSKREFLDYVQDILDSIDEIESFISGMDHDEFNEDRKTVNAVIRSLEVIGEAAKKVPKEITDRYNKVPWKKMCAMRDKLIHEYFGVDEDIVWKVATEEIPPIKPFIQQILDESK